ncbi:hypothetical protein M9H77_07880 [Catharanthus roseus]|uniref:Uncharacterized protein n=1 Tax=Catharanthus roseus TaxID=4058 RepID=A0ACC0BW85_CATRO|nr:hypothetical protein M9H77_07880 [Catharanthus roseus]
MPNGKDEEDLPPEVGQPTTDDRALVKTLPKVGGNFPAWAKGLPIIYQVVLPWLLSQLLDVLAFLTSSHQAVTLQEVEEQEMKFPMFVDEEGTTAQAPEESTIPEEEEAQQEKKNGRRHNDLQIFKEPLQATSVVNDSRREECSPENKREFANSEPKKENESLVKKKKVSRFFWRNSNQLPATSARHLRRRNGTDSISNNGFFVQTPPGYSSTLLPLIGCSCIFGFYAPFGNWVGSLCCAHSGDYYPDLVREFYANMVHKMDKDLPTIISIVKGVRIILNRERLASILGIRDQGNIVAVTPIKSLLMRNLIRVSTRVFSILVYGNDRWTTSYTPQGRLSTRSPQIIKFTTFNNCEHSWNEKNKVWIPLAKMDKLRERDLSGFRSIKKTTQTKIGASSLQPDDKEGKDNESYDLSGEDEPPTAPMVAFQKWWRCSDFC